MIYENRATALNRLYHADMPLAIGGGTGEVIRVESPEDVEKGDSSREPGASIGVSRISRRSPIEVPGAAGYATLREQFGWRIHADIQDIQH